ncbi:DMT family transporter [Thiofilum flexile]|uniref:DMT family transporter n=1 Tax=Thiofilum flexile TaxID=125627 RepID=UPI0003726FDB|nr:DMT family transporter [Thiofilum flexile]
MTHSVLDRVSPYLLLILTTLFWAGNFNLARAVSTQVPPMSLSYWRWTIAALLLLPFVWKHLIATWNIFKKNWLLVSALALLGVTGFNSLVYLGLQTTTAINGVLMQSVCPIFIIILATFLLGERATGLQWLGIITSLLGVVIILVRGDIQVLKTLSFTYGDLILLVAVLSWALYTVLLRKLPAALKGLPILGYTIVLGSMMILPLYLYETYALNHPMPITWVSMGSIAYVAIFPSLLAYWFWNYATAKLGAGRTGQFTHLIPVFGLTIATLLLGERLYSFHWLGGALVALGLVLSNWKSKAA